MTFLEVQVEEDRKAVIAEIQEMIRRSKDQYLGWRVVGLVVPLSGAIVLSAAISSDCEQAQGAPRGHRTSIGGTFGTPDPLG